MNTLESKISALENNKDSALLQEINLKLSDPSTLPYSFYQGCAVVYNDEIHILGGYGGNKTSHYKWNGSKWTYASALPVDLCQGCAVVYNGEIHIFGGSGTSHYKWDGSKWTYASTLPHTFKNGCAVVYSDRIHLLGGTGDALTNHYIWHEDNWSKQIALPVNLVDNIGSVIEYKNQLHLFKENKHYVWRYGDWELKTTSLPINFNFIKSVVINNELHILGGNSDNNSHYKYDGTRWMNASVLPYYFYEGCAVVYNDRIHLLGGHKLNVTTGNEYKHFII